MVANGNNKAWDREVDVIVLGAGPAGMAAAIVSKNEGLEPLIVEKTDQVGGVGAWSVGMMWFVDSTPMRAAGFEDSTEKARRYFSATVGNSAPADLQDAYVEQGRVALDYLLKHSDLEVAAVNYPDYNPEIDGGMFGRAHAPLEFDARKLGPAFNDVRAPLPAFAPFGGMMLDLVDLMHFLSVTRSLKSFLHVTKRLSRYGLDRLMGYRRGTRLVGGNALVARFYKTILDRRIEVWRRSHATSLVLDRNTVAGAEISREGKTLRIRARRGVVIATGGYPGNLEMRREHSRKPTVERTLGLASNVGEGIGLGQSAGGRLDRNSEDTGFYVPMSELKTPGGEKVLWAHFMLDRPMPGFIAVRSDGARFTNEAASYHAFTLGMFNAGAIPAFLIADSAAIKKYGVGLVLPGAGARSLRRFEKAGYLHSGRTPSELARKIGVDPQGLERTVNRFNRFASTGVDEDFGKGSTPYNAYKGDPTHKPNPCLGPILRAPYYAIKLEPGDFGTSRGLVTGPHGEVLDQNNRPVEGLYACGNDMNSPVGGHYIGAGITLGPALTFAYLAAQDIAGRRPLQERVQDKTPRAASH
jgi:hypothetical protein